MFETATLSSGPRTKRVWATALGIGGQAILLGWMLIAPLIWPRSLPDMARSISLAAPPAPVGRAKPVETRVEPRTNAPSRVTHAFTTPVTVPKRVVILSEAETPEPTGPFVAGALPGSGDASGNPVLGAVLGDGARNIPVRPPDPPAPLKQPEPTRPQRVTEVRMAEPIQRVNPVYPEMAKRTRISGKVE